VLEANAQVTQASNSLDVDRFFAYILDSDKGPVIQDGRLFKTRAEALEAVRAGFQGVTKAERRYDQTFVTVLSPQAALLTAAGSSTATLSGGQTLTSPFALSLVFVLRDGQWKILHGHYSIPNG
jgi:ketosteroid isomerase-like protein